MNILCVNRNQHNLHFFTLLIVYLLCSFVLYHIKITCRFRFGKLNIQVAEVSAVMVESWFGVVYHELAHCYDTNFSTYHRFSDSSKFTKLYKEEYDIWCGTFRNYKPYEYTREVFARSVSFYFEDPEYLKENAPGIYAYLDALFGEEAAA